MYIFAALVMVGRHSSFNSSRILKKASVSTGISFVSSVERVCGSLNNHCQKLTSGANASAAMMLIPLEAAR